MDRSTLPRHARAHVPGWAHPYPHGVFSPFFYADGDDSDDSDDDAVDDSDGQDDGAGDDDEADAGDGGQDDEDDADPDGAEELGDKGKRALASMKGKWKSERDRRRALEERLAEQDSKDDADAARRKAEQDATAKANGRILRSEVRAAAKGRLADPKDALTFLDLDQFEVNEDGEVDEDEIAEAIEDLIKNKPYLAAAKATRFQGTGDGGAARKAGRPKQLTERDLKTMTPEQIVKAQEAGQLDDLLGAG
ncbi:hypothetical protein [Streptomyces pacificus]|uniref:Uncharacterized protein n=1 Tax=Streptomyces pacificus TaxID=2705029 RepID=A0A6A0B1B6_9ACTN|nr:hypothetical protein [Streptomyces pacificus]GFH38906.1 hypothetical protein SCWH03_51690 [Streptomyces pacificus]